MSEFRHTERCFGNAVRKDISWVPEAGYGLFTTSHIPFGSLVCTYYGVKLSTSSALKLKDKSYLMRLGQQCYVDASGNPEVVQLQESMNSSAAADSEESKSAVATTAAAVSGESQNIQQTAVENTGECLARYINDCRNPLCYNVRFDKDPLEGVARVVALRDIDAGEELFVDYGRWYWLSLTPSRLPFAEVQRRRKGALEAATGSGSGSEAEVVAGGGVGGVGGKEAAAAGAEANAVQAKSVIASAPVESNRSAANHFVDGTLHEVES